MLTPPACTSPSEVGLGTRRLVIYQVGLETSRDFDQTVSRRLETLIVSRQSLFVSRAAKLYVATNEKFSQPPKNFHRKSRDISSRAQAYGRHSGNIEHLQGKQNYASQMVIVFNAMNVLDIVVNIAKPPSDASAEETLYSTTQPHDAHAPHFSTSHDINVQGPSNWTNSTSRTTPTSQISLSCLARSHEHGYPTFLFLLEESHNPPEVELDRSQISMTMAPPPKGVVYGPIKDWRKGSCKLLLEFGSKEGKKGRRQYVLEEVERDLRGEEEIIRVMEGPSIERAVGILSKGIAIQDGAANGQLEGYEVDYQTAVQKDGMLESITVKPARVSGEAIFRMAHHWTLMTPISKKGAIKGQPAGWVGRLGEVGEEEGESKDEVMRKKSKKHRIGEARPLEVLGKELGIDSVEPAVPRELEDIRANVFGVTPPAWNLKESQEDWLMEKPQATLDWAKDMDRGTAGLLTLEDSIHAVKGLSEEEAEELTKGLVEGQGYSKDEEDEDMESEDEGTEDKWNS
ncbi:hypothetical protein L211DRAFT_893547 [Terfezia boudieri ATCC MYA-4762]|uniref:Uncharacterized protein n=1 Tax=Terfezia boudieri ATCC MYA-4762 TaxID=1051890 RepID=A0A3N4LBX2_9PEZI|nr:hypothetical protein L211DRAFT_893547 [Terfezia boudieri ATCC MYA-4762]